jgi:hypothetical protein
LGAPAWDPVAVALSPTRPQAQALTASALACHPCPALAWPGAQECGEVRNCRLDQLDKEMAGGLAATKAQQAAAAAAKACEVVPVQLAVFKSVLGGDTIGLKP